MFAKEREFYSENEAFVSVMFLHNGALKKDKDLAEKLHGESSRVGGIVYRKK